MTAWRSTLVVFLLLPFSMFGCSGQGTVPDGSLEKYRVHVGNALQSPPEMLMVHCRSGDDDLGVQQVPPGQEFSWVFRMNVFESTLFWCNVKRQDGLHASFCAFNYTLSEEGCADHNCRWNVREDGVYVLFNGSEARWYSWINP